MKAKGARIGCSDVIAHCGLTTIFRSSRTSLFPRSLSHPAARLSTPLTTHCSPTLHALLRTLSSSSLSLPPACPPLPIYSPPPPLA